MEKKQEKTPNPFFVGDVVYVLGKYLPDSSLPILLLECRISHIKNRQFVAYRTDGEVGEWKFSRKDCGKCVFKERKEAEKVWKEINSSSL